MAIQAIYIEPDSDDDLYAYFVHAYADIHTAGDG